MLRPPETCPNCGADVPRNAKACPGCGADENTGWAEDAQQATAADLGLPDEDFDCDEFAKREFGKASANPRGLHWVWWLAGIAVLVAILFTWVL
jgi:zinc-ribbon domain